jgi:hypothetical protein
MARIDSRATCALAVLAAALLAAAPPAAHADDVGGDDTGAPASRRTTPTDTSTPAPAAPAAEAATPDPAAQAVIQPATGRAIGTGEGFHFPTLEGDWRFRVSFSAFLPQDIPITVNTRCCSDTDTLHLNTFLLPALTYYIPIDAEIRKGPFGVFAHTIWYKLRDSKQIGRYRHDWDDEGWFIDAGLSYEVGSWNLGDGPNAPTVTLEPFAAARILKDDVDVFLGDDKVSDDFNYTVPIVGLRAFFVLSEHWNLRFEGDYGGFGIDDNDQTWQALGMIGYRWRGWGAGWNFQLGYRALQLLDLQRRFDSDIQADLRGPQVAISVEF